ncbi:hypothetical protein ES703_76416 [subsurface metagenome]
MLERFGLTLLAVFASFLLWFGGEKLFNLQNANRARKYLIQEICNEIEMNIGVLDTIVKGIRSNEESGSITMVLPRLNLATYEYIIASGEIRLLNREAGRLFREASYLSECFNGFVTNTELLLAISHLKEQSAALFTATYRLSKLIEEAESKKSSLESYLNELKTLLGL